MAEALVALGGNLGDVRDTIDRAVATFCDDRGVRLIARSSDYRTLPWGVKDQPVFVNACIAVETRLPPRALLARAQAVERTLGRERSKERRWGPRQIDIDLIAYEDVALEAPDLTLPHPQLFTRAFAAKLSERHASVSELADAFEAMCTVAEDLAATSLAQRPSMGRSNTTASLSSALQVPIAPAAPGMKEMPVIVPPGCGMFGTKPSATRSVVSATMGIVVPVPRNARRETPPMTTMTST